MTPDFETWLNSKYETYKNETPQEDRVFKNFTQWYCNRYPEEWISLANEFAKQEVERATSKKS